MEWNSQNTARGLAKTDRAPAPWWKLPCACFLSMVMMGCCTFVWTIQYVQLSVFMGHHMVVTILAPALYFALIGLGCALGGMLAQKSGTPMQLMARLALAGGALAALCVPWMNLSASMYYYWGNFLQGFPGGIALAGVLAAGWAFFPSALLAGAIIPVAVSLAGAGKRSRGLLLGSWMVGAALGPFISFGLYLSLTGPVFWIPSVVFIATAIGSNNLARISPVAFPDNQKLRMSIKEIMALLGAGMFLAVLTWCLVRLLIPLFGTGFAVPLILFLCLFLGIALGGGLFHVRGKPGTQGIAACLCLMGLWLGFVWAMGDKLVVLYDGLISFRILGFPLFYGLQAAVTACVVWPVGAAAGFLICGLHPSGDIVSTPGREGKAMALLALGAVAGILFYSCLASSGITATSILRGACLLALGVSGVLSLNLVFRRAGKAVPGIILVFCLISLQMLRLPGPSVVWTQHDLIRGGSCVAGKDFNSVLDWMRSVHRHVTWERASLGGATAIQAHNSLSLVENGLVRANVRQDAARDVMMGLAPAALHPTPGNALVLGLGTGCTAGWLARVDSIHHVEVVEENPQCLEMASRCATANFRVLENPKVKVRAGSFRPALFFSEKKYDLIIQDGGAAPLAFNPGLYTREFFRQAAARLANGGLFALSLSIRGMDAIALQSIYGALGESFAHVHTFRPQPESLLLVCSVDEIQFREDRLRKRLASQPYAAALVNTWGVQGLEGLFSRYLAGPGFSRMLSGMATWNHIVNSDDQPHAYAIQAGSKGRLRPDVFLSMRDTEERDHYRRPFFSQGGADLKKTGRWQVEMFILEDSPDIGPDLFSRELGPMALACQAFQQGDYLLFLNRCKILGLEPEVSIELAMAAYAFAMEGNDSALYYSSRLEKTWPEAARICRARFFWNTGRHREAIDTLDLAFQGASGSPWVWPATLEWGLDLAEEIAREDKTCAPKVLSMISSPFCLMQAEDQRLEAQLAVSIQVGPIQAVSAIEAYGPYSPWTREFLKQRLVAYRLTQDPRTDRALEDMQAYLSETLLSFSDALVYE